MTDSAYPIIDIHPDWVLEEEAMGSKQKFWFREHNTAAEWLFKYPQPHTGQHWAEKIAAEVAALLEILHAPVELASFQETQGSATESFAREGRELYHGNQVLAGQLLRYDPDKRFRQSMHTLDNILAALKQVFESEDSTRWAGQRLADFLVLDALIGNTDRHHENWGILRKRTPGGWSEMVAPTFDHASSLGRELRDEGEGQSRQRILAEGRLPRYAERARGAIFWDETDRRGPSPLELVRRGAVRHPSLFAPALGRLGRVSRITLGAIVDRIPADWMSALARQFALELMCYNLDQLNSIDP